MSQNQGQIQEQKLEQRLGQSITQQQLLHAQLVEMPLPQLLERIDTEMNDNPALETVADTPDFLDAPDNLDDDAPDDFDSQREREDRLSAFDEALQGIGRDDEDLPVFHGGNNVNEEREQMVYGEATSFYDQLREQLTFCELTEREHDIMEYLIGSLDDDGLLRKSLSQIGDELAVYHNIDATEKELESVLRKLQDFDPAGIGARSLQECLLLQIARRDDSRLKTLMQRVVSDFFDEFTKKHWDKIQSSLQLSDVQAKALFQELRRLNPKPGASLGETMGHSVQQITPDFIIDTQDDGVITFTLNNAEVPELQVSQSFADSMKEYQNNSQNLSRQTKEALLYIRRKVEAAQNFIEAINMRRRTLTLTMQAIIQLQRKFFLDGDEASLRPMILRDVAEKTGLDLSTISRVSNSKYAQTRWGTFPLRYFFSDGYATESGEMSTRQIKAVLRDIIDAEDKHKPLSDEALTAAMAQKGFPIARRTVAKYREQLGIPVARLRSDK
jgi:RNA polymerase, sigma 54 subunit, RpoN/SigL